MDSTGWFVVVVLVIGIIGGVIASVIKTSLKIWEHRALNTKRENLYNWEDRL